MYVTLAAMLNSLVTNIPFSTLRNTTASQNQSNITTTSEQRKPNHVKKKQKRQVRKH